MPGLVDQPVRRVKWNGRNHKTVSFTIEAHRLAGHVLCRFGASNVQPHRDVVQLLLTCGLWSHGNEDRKKKKKKKEISACKTTPTGLSRKHGEGSSAKTLGLLHKLDTDL